MDFYQSEGGCATGKLDAYVPVVGFISLFVREIRK
ncbi:hypothetical protein BH18ACI3_BH18ACI3_03790 [soil metagenome]